MARMLKSETDNELPQTTELLPRGSSGASLDTVIEVVSNRVGRYWKELLDTIGLDSEVDRRKILRECIRQEGGSGSMEKSCADHMFAIWKSRVLSNGVPESQAKQVLLLALQSVPQLELLSRDVKNLIDDKAKLDMDTDVQFQKKFLAGECMHCVYSIIIMPTFCTGP
jgi:hypothetical protein